MIYKFMTAMYWAFLAAICFGAVDAVDGSLLVYLKYMCGVLCILVAVMRVVED